MEGREITILEKVQDIKKILQTTGGFLERLTGIPPEGLKKREEKLSGLVPKLSDELKDVSALATNLHSQAFRLLERFEATEVKQAASQHDD